MSAAYPRRLSEAHEAGLKTARADADRLYRDHGGWLRRVLALRVGPDAAEDLAQETWLRLSAARLDGPVRHPRTLLFRIARSALIDGRRRAAVRPQPAPLDLLDAPPGEAPVQVASLTLKQMVQRMPEPLREVFLLSRVGGLSYQSIADHLNISVKTVEWRLSKALAYCAARLQD